MGYMPPSVSDTKCPLILFVNSPSLLANNTENKSQSVLLTQLLKEANNTNSKLKRNPNKNGNPCIVLRFSEVYVLMCVVTLNNLFLPFHNRREKKRQGKRTYV